MQQNYPLPVPAPEPEYKDLTRESLAKVFSDLFYSKHAERKVYNPFEFMTPGARKAFNDAVREEYQKLHPEYMQWFSKPEPHDGPSLKDKLTGNES